MLNYLQKRWICSRKLSRMKKIQSKSLLSLDVPTRWNSIYLMLKAIEKFDRMHEEDVKFSSYFMEVDENGKQKHIGPPKGED